MNDPIVVTRSLVKRGWTDFEPKVIAGLLSGSAGAFLIPVLANFGIHLSAIQANYAVVGAYFIGSYIIPSSGTKVTQTFDTPAAKHVESEAHSGNAVTTVTASTPVQKLPEPEPESEQPTMVQPSSFAEARWGVPSTNAIAVTPPVQLPTPDENATEVWR